MTDDATLSSASRNEDEVQADLDEDSLDDDDDLDDADEDSLKP